MAAKQALERLGVEVLIGKVATICDERGVVVVDAPSAVPADGKAHSATVVASERIGSCTIIWAAGVAASPAAKWLGAEKDRAGRVIVGPDLTLPRHPEIFVIGDTALAKSASGQPLPGIASVAKQQGRYVANVIRARLSGEGRLNRFVTATLAISRRSGAKALSPISASCGSPVASPGCFGAQFMSFF